MFQFNYKLKVAERVKAKCERHPRYNPERDGRGNMTIEIDDLSKIWLDAVVSGEGVTYSYLA
jgi:hypothetical protein